MKNYIIKKAIHSGAFFLIALIMEIFLFNYLGMGLLAKYWIIDLSAFLFVSILLFLLPLKLQAIIAPFVMLIPALLSITNICLYASSTRLFEWYMIGLLGETVEVLGMAVFPFWPIIFYVVLFIGFIVLTILLFVRIKTRYYKSFIKQIYSIVCCTILVGIIILQIIFPSVIISRYDKESFFISDSYDYTTFYSPYISLNKFGIIGYYGTSFLRKLFPKLTPEIQLKTTDFNYENYTTEIQGVAKDDNLIVICAESLDEYAISKELTPTLYALKNGINLSDIGISKFYNIYTDETTGLKSLHRKDFDEIDGHFVTNNTDIYDNLELNQCGFDLVNYKSFEATNTSETKILTGNNISYAQTISKLANSVGYISNYIHGNYDWFYSRGFSMKYNLEFKNSIFYDSMKDKINSTDDLNCFLLDYDLVNYYTANENEFDFTPDQKFFTFFMTISTHGGYYQNNILNDNYNFLDNISKHYENDNSILDLYNSLTDIELKNTVRTYLAKVLDAEKSVALLVNNLYEENKLNNTIITFVADHNAYSNGISNFKKAYYEKYLKQEYLGNSTLYNVPCIIYSTKINNKSIDNYAEKRIVNSLTNHFDILPTLLSLIDVDYIQEKCMGLSLFSKSVMTGQYLKTDIIYSYSYGFFIGNNFTTSDGKNIESSKIFNMSDKLIIQNYINNYLTKQHIVSTIVLNNIK